MTTQVKSYLFEMTIAGARRGAALADQVKSLDWVARNVRYKGKVAAAELREVRAKIAALVESTN
jgi:mRNA interferase MazF